MPSIDEVREKALANFDILLHYWKLDYKKITEYEYDILATWRKDQNFGSVRFNLDKARGADFAGGSLTDIDFSKLGSGFTKEDFNGFTSQGQSKIGFDIVGLCQRVYQKNTYQEAAKCLNNDLEVISKHRKLFTPAADAAIRREKEQQQKTKRHKELANDLWESCKYHNFFGSVGEKYLLNRGIRVKDKNIRCHPSIRYGISKTNYPALLFKVQAGPDKPLTAIHRIYLSQNGTKAKLENPKMALAPIKGMGIWIGNPSRTLALTEGPENALTLRELGHNFVVSSIFGTNLHNINIPKYVRKLIIYPDPDEPGMASFDRAKKTYTKLGIEVEGYVLPRGKFDLNDLINGTING